MGFPGEIHALFRQFALITAEKRSPPPLQSLCRQQDGGAGGGGGALGSVRPLRDAALHLQHFGPSVELVGFWAVFYVLEEQNTAGLMFNQTRWALVKVWPFQTGGDTETLKLNV